MTARHFCPYISRLLLFLGRGGCVSTLSASGASHAFLSGSVTARNCAIYTAKRGPHGGKGNPTETGEPVFGETSPALLLAGSALRTNAVRPQTKLTDGRDSKGEHTPILKAQLLEKSPHRQQYLPRGFQARCKAPTALLGPEDAQATLRQASSRSKLQVQGLRSKH